MHTQTQIPADDAAGLPSSPWRNFRNIYEIRTKIRHAKWVFVRTDFGDYVQVTKQAALTLLGHTEFHDVIRASVQCERRHVFIHKMDAA